jgi:hypothetical protein
LGSGSPQARGRSADFGNVGQMVGGKEVTEKKTWSYWHLSDYKWWTYKELAAVVKQAGSALVKTGHSKDTIFNIYSSTSPRWQVMANGGFFVVMSRGKERQLTSVFVPAPQHALRRASRSPRLMTVSERKVYVLLFAVSSPPSSAD